MSKTPAIRIDDASLLEAHQFAKDTQARFLEAFRARFAPGAAVSWVYGSRDEVQHGKVLLVGSDGERLKVANYHGGAEYWIHGWRVLEAMRRE